MTTTTDMVIIFESTGEDAMFAVFSLLAIIGGAFLFAYLFKLGNNFWV